MYIHMWSASSSESIALLSDAESDSCFGLSEDPLVFDREPANLKTRSRAGLAGPQHSRVRFQAARRRPLANAAPARTAPPPPQAEAADTATQGRPSPVTLTIVDLRLPDAPAAPAAAAP